MPNYSCHHSLPLLTADRNTGSFTPRRIGIHSHNNPSMTSCFQQIQPTGNR